MLPRSLDSTENDAAVHSGSATAVLPSYCLSKIQGGGLLEILEVAENGRFAW